MDERPTEVPRLKDIAFDAVTAFTHYGPPVAAVDRGPEWTELHEKMELLAIAVMLEREGGLLTPPNIVAEADHPAIALGTFIAQELESWGFEVPSEELPAAPPGVFTHVVRAGDRLFGVTVSELAAI